MDTVQPPGGGLAELMTRWLAGWTRARGYRSVRDGDGTIQVHVGYPGREVEHLAVVEAPDAHAELLERVAAQPGHRVTLPTHDHEATGHLIRSAGYDHHQPEWLMTRLLPDHPEARVPPGYHVVHSSHGDVHVVEITSARGLAAKGQAAVVGTDAVVDRIFTMPAHRRRGLGRVVMGTLAAVAVTHGARTGLLVATAQGRALYSVLGWHGIASLVMAGNPDDLRRETASEPPSGEPLE